MRKRIYYCEKCKIKPINSRDCNGCMNLGRLAYSRKNRAKLNLSRKLYASKNQKYELKRKRLWREKNYDYHKKQNLEYKDKIRYGEFASCHRTYLKTKKLLKEMTHEKN